jgi:hypothetical protein
VRLGRDRPLSRRNPHARLVSGASPADAGGQTCAAEVAERDPSRDTRWGAAVSRPKGNPGRPRVESADERRDSVVYVRVTAAERELIDAAAERDRRSASDWARITLVDAASVQSQS